MIDVIYVAKRSIMATHNAGIEYELTLKLSQDDRGFQARGRTNTALGGNTVSVINRLDETWNLASIFLRDDSMPGNADMREFLNSVAQGEQFQMGDAGGDTDTFILNNLRRPYTAQRNGFGNLFSYRFSARKLT